MVKAGILFQQRVTQEAASLQLMAVTGWSIFGNCVTEKTLVVVEGAKIALAAGRICRGIDNVFYHYYNSVKVRRLEWLMVLQGWSSKRASVC
jgi:hypothetical protein